MNDTEVLARLLAAHRLIAEVAAVTGLRASISNEIIIRGAPSVQFARRQGAVPENWHGSPPRRDNAAIVNDVRVCAIETQDSEIPYDALGIELAARVDELVDEVTG